MTDNYTVLIVDDSPADLQMVLSVVTGQFKATAATSGAQALEVCTKNRPDLVLLDVSMPEMDGYETCKLLKQDYDIPVIFLSANDTTDEILKGYDVGGNDYIIKPFEPDVLLNKIKTAFIQQKQRSELKQEADYASEVAMAAISSSSEMSSVVGFLRESFSANNVVELAAIAVNCLANYELQGSLQFRTTEGTYNYATNNSVSELEAELLKRIAQMPERIHENNARMFVNFEQASLLIKNIPITDQEKTGRLRDYLMILIEGINAKLVMFDAEHKTIVKRDDSISGVINDIKVSLDSIAQQQKDIELENIRIFDRLADDIDELFIGLNLSDDQEDSILALVQEALNSSGETFNKGKALEQEMHDVLNKVATLRGT